MIEIGQLIYYTLLLLFPILPQYIYIFGGVNAVNCIVLLFIIGVLLIGRIRTTSVIKYLPFFWLYEIIISLLCMADGGAIKGFSYFLSFFVIPYLLAGYINSKDKFFKAIDLIIYGGFILGIFGIFEQLTKINVFQLLSNGNMEFTGDTRYGLLRIMTTFGQPIAYGLYQTFVSVIIYYRLNTDILNQRRRFLKIAYMISVANIFLSVSRTPILAFCLIQLLLLYQKSKKRFINILFLIFFVIIVGGLLGEVTGLQIPLIDDLVQTVFGLFQGVAQTSEQTVGIGDRFSLWIWVFSSMSGKWIFGNGITTEFAYQVYEWQTKTSIENHYLYTLFHYGLVGLLLLLFMYISILIYTKLKSKKYGTRLNEKNLSFNKMLFIVFFIYNIVEFAIQETDLSRMYVVLVALLISYNKISDRQYEITNYSEDEY